MKTAVVITGAAGAIGRSLGQAFRQDGAFVIGTDLPKCKPPAQGFDAWVPADLAQLARDPSAMKTFVSQVTQASPAIGTFVLNAATQVVKPFRELTREELDQSIAVNLSANVFLVQAFREVLAKHHGSVIVISSVHARTTKPGFAAYAISKAAVSGMVRALSTELAPEVRINAIEPAAIDTPMLREGFHGDTQKLSALGAVHPMDRIGKPEEVANLAVFLASGRAPFMTGACLPLDGGLSARLKDVD